MRTGGFSVVLGLVILLFAVRLGLSQQVTVGSPFNTASSGFFEQNGVSWGGHWGGITYNVGNAGLAQPAFGGFNANAGLSTAFAISGRQGQANFFLNFGQGSTQSLVSQTPSVTVMNGQTGYFSDTSQTPFVISYVPVVGGAPIIGSFGAAPSGFVNSMSDPTAGSRVQAMRKMMQPMNQNSGDDGAVGVPAAGGPGPAVAPPRPRAAAQVARRAAVAEALPPPARHAVVEGDEAGERLAAAQASSAGRPAPSVAEARRLHSLEQGAENGEGTALLERGRTAEEDGKPQVAKIYYQMAVKRASGDLKEQAQSRLDAVQTKHD